MNSTATNTIRVTAFNGEEFALFGWTPIYEMTWEAKKSVRSDTGNILGQDEVVPYGALKDASSGESVYIECEEESPEGFPVYERVIVDAGEKDPTENKTR